MVMSLKSVGQKLPLDLFGIKHGPSVLISTRVSKACAPIPRVLQQRAISGSLAILYNLPMNIRKLVYK